MELTPSQERAAKSKSRFRVLCWGRGTGKTELAIEECIHVAIAKKNRRVVYIATTIQQARDTAWSRLRERLLPITLDKNESRLEITVRTQDGGTSYILLRGWEAIDTLRGQEFDFIVVDEVAYMRDFFNGWEKVLRPTLRMSKGGTLFISTPNGFNHFYELYEKAKQSDDFESFHATSYDNPHIDDQEIQSAKATLPPDTFAQEYLADFRKIEGLVYKEFEQRHIVSDLPKKRMVVETRGCIDFGFNNPTAVYSITKDRDNVYYVHDEFYQPGKVQEEINQLLSSRKVVTWYPDPAEPDRIESMRRAGLRTSEVSKDVKAGIGAVQNLLRQNRLYVHKNCTNLIFEFNHYRWREPLDSKVNRHEPEEPVKEHDHGLDAIRYALYMWESSNDDGIKDFYQKLSTEHRAVVGAPE